ncbi:DUF5342 family protein [Neobacillus mesonae]|uniref:HicA family toxin-antitoxin system n=1 Tax=Neobacillus mesonae TaxID=1193713 RepID=A0A3Q9R1P6_9BACI|nr:DUF5342 family protein [Neobacillus mesonae]AZU64498.1 hypothetical protein CHR53_26525 [Neobacillus mesonae]
MFNNFDIEKTMFEGQFHERYQFSLNYKGNHYKGIYHDGDIAWFQPHPLNDLEKEFLNNIEEKVQERMQEPFALFNDFDIEKTIFEDQFHERYQFSLNYEGNHYKGIYHNGNITWFHPHPLNDLEEEPLNNIKEEVRKRMGN